MNQPTRRLLETLVLAATTLCLLGHGGDVPTCYVHAGESRSYNLVGTCGPAGVVTVSHPSNSCSVNLTGDAVGLPSSGNLAHGLDSGFNLYGSLNGDWDLMCDAGLAGATDAGTSVGGTMALTCWRYPSGSTPYNSRVGWCQADLVPLSNTCNVDGCPAANCPAGQHTILPLPSCCPACVVDGSSDFVPTSLPPVCHPETCPQTCPTGEEMVYLGDACCGTCQAPSQQCLDGRTGWRDELATRWSTARACTTDADCTITSFGSQCGSSCVDGIAIDQIAALNDWAGSRGNELCSSCAAPAAATGCPNRQSVRPACSNENCVAVGL